MWRHRNSIYPFINGAATSALLAFLAASAFLQVVAMTEKTQVNAATTEEWQRLITPPSDSRTIAPEFSVAFSEPDGPGGNQQN
jgi:hypothetical protein